MASPGASEGMAAPAVAVTDESEVDSSPPTAAAMANTSSQRTTPRTLDGAMRAPSATLPDVVVLGTLFGAPLERKEALDPKEVLDPKEDLWLSTADGRYSSPVIPLRVGEPPYVETFYVHKYILTEYEYFEKALCGGFVESERQALEFPDEDPATFHFLVAFLYEGRYEPLKSIASAIIPDPDKGKGKEADSASASDTEGSAASDTFDTGTLFSPHRDRQRRHLDRTQQKHPGSHRPDCGCPTCLSRSRPVLMVRAAPPAVPMPVPMPPQHPMGGDPFYATDRNGNVLLEDNAHAHPHQPRAVPTSLFASQREPPRHMDNNNNNGNTAAGHRRTPAAPSPPPPRIAGEDLQTWLLAYELHVDVYILANKFLLGDFQRAVARAAVDMLETAGSAAAVPAVLGLCARLHRGLPAADPLLRMVLARVGFMQPDFWRRDPAETEAFLVENPEVAAAVLRETMRRRDRDYFRGKGRPVFLPSMETHRTQPDW